GRPRRGDDTVARRGRRGAVGRDSRSRRCHLRTPVTLHLPAIPLRRANMRARRVLFPALALVFISDAFAHAAGAAPPVDQAAPPPERQGFAKSPQYPLLPRALEIEVAVSAAPKHLRDQATVWVLDQNGYTKVKGG